MGENSEFGYKTVKMIEPGTYVLIPGMTRNSDMPDKLRELSKSDEWDDTYEIVASRVEWPEGGQPTQFATILAVDTNADDMGFPAITVNLDLYDYSVVY